MESYLPLVLALAASGLLGLVFLAASFFLGPKRLDSMKRSTFECGNPPTVDARRPFAVRFYLVAVLFVVFDVALAFLYPWAVLLRGELGGIGFSAMLVFTVPLLVALVYVWRRGALDIEEPAEREPAADGRTSGSAAR